MQKVKAERREPCRETYSRKRNVEGFQATPALSLLTIHAHATIAPDVVRIGKGCRKGEHLQVITEPCRSTEDIRLFIIELYTLERSCNSLRAILCARHIRIVIVVEGNDRIASRGVDAHSGGLKSHTPKEGQIL